MRGYPGGMKGPVPGTSKFKSQNQRGFMFANCPKAAHKWAHGLPTTKNDWRGCNTAKAKLRG